LYSVIFINQISINWLEKALSTQIKIYPNITWTSDKNNNSQLIFVNSFLLRQFLLAGKADKILLHRLTDAGPLETLKASFTSGQITQSGTNSKLYFLLVLNYKSNKYTINRFVVSLKRVKTCNLIVTKN
jgi:hypothetical protein